MKPINYLDLPIFYNDKLLYKKTNIGPISHIKPRIVQRLPAYLFNRKEEPKVGEMWSTHTRGLDDGQHISSFPTLPKPITKSEERIQSTLQRLEFLTNQVDLCKIFKTNGNTSTTEKNKLAETTYSSMRRIPIPEQEVREEEEKEGEEEADGDGQSTPYQLSAPKLDGTRILLKRIRKQRETKAKIRKTRLRRYRFLRKKINRIRAFWAGETMKIPFIFRIFDSKEEQADSREEVIELSGKLVQPKLFLSNK